MTSKPDTAKEHPSTWTQGGQAETSHAMTKSTNAIEHQDSPSATHQHFIYDPLGNGFLYFRSAAERDQAMDWVVQTYLDDEWSEEVEQIVAGEVTHSCQSVGVQNRPRAELLDKNNCDSEGNHWGSFAFRCNYELLPLAPKSSMSA
ncbi:hypothetical protein [Pseudomonas syringae]|uniref:hypothetical protein n=1 Tax=Pseudomonas syringae TaxID=317 RepID=UPI00245AB45F|nr:hypothetical protein [Pseudomonas syringae]MDH4602501.1 hypothetical protein [Pseudomonas syringae pv. papulans]